MRSDTSAVDATNIVRYVNQRRIGDILCPGLRSASPRTILPIKRKIGNATITVAIPERKEIIQRKSNSPGSARCILIKSNSMTPSAKTVVYKAENSIRKINASFAEPDTRLRGTGSGRSLSTKASSAALISLVVHPPFIRPCLISSLDTPRESASYTKSEICEPICSSPLSCRIQPTGRSAKRPVVRSAFLISAFL